MSSPHESLGQTLKVFNLLIHHELLENSQGQGEIDERGVELITQAIDKMAEDMIRIQNLPDIASESHLLEHLAYYYLLAFLKPRVAKTKSSDLIQMLNEMESTLRELATQHQLFNEQDALFIVEQASRSLENVLQISEYLVRAPKKWMSKWDQRENLDVKINSLGNELGIYRSRLESELLSLEETVPEIQKGAFVWPLNHDAISILLQLSILQSPTGIAAIATDPEATIELIVDTPKGIERIHSNLEASEKALQNLKDLNASLRGMLENAMALAEEGNYEQATTLLEKVPPAFQSFEQKHIHEVINKCVQRINYIKALYDKTKKRDLQKLEWVDIQKFCHNERAGIIHSNENATDYERNILPYLESLEVLIRKQARNRIIKIAVIVPLIIFISCAVGYFVHLQDLAEREFELIVTPKSGKTQWQIFDDSGIPVGEAGTGGKTLKMPRQTYTVRFVNNGKTSLDKVQPYKESEARASEDSALRNPFVKLLTLEPGQSAAQQLCVDGVPIDPSHSGCHIPVGMRKFSLKQEGLPDYDVSYLISKNSTEFSLISPWQVVTLESEAQDLRASVNNGAKRRIPTKVYLPVGTHFIIITDSNNDIRMSREFKVEKQAENKIEYNAAFGTLNLSTSPPHPEYQILINGINFGAPPKIIKLATSQIKVQLVYNNKVVQSFSESLPAGETLEKVVEFASP